MRATLLALTIGSVRPSRATYSPSGNRPGPRGAPTRLHLSRRAYPFGLAPSPSGATPTSLRDPEGRHRVEDGRARDPTLVFSELFRQDWQHVANNFPNARKPGHG